MWINPLDRVPQLRSDYANHVFYGGLLGIVVAVAAHFAGMPPALTATCATLAVAGAKKLIDFIKVGPPTESAGACIAKTIATALWPASFLLLGVL